MGDELTYPGGAEEILTRWNARRAAFLFKGESLPPPDADLAALRQARVPPEAAETDAKRKTWALKRAQIAPEFIDHSELAFLNAQLIANLRRESFPEHAPALFRRLWREEADHLISTLDLRWCVSSAQTFADHGTPGPERELGQSLRMLFGLMKLYEFERLFTGTAPDTPHRFGKRSSAPMPLRMDPYSLNHGGLDVALLAPLFPLADQAPNLGPLARHLLDALNADAGTVFRRISKMKERRANIEKDKEKRR